MNINKTEVVVLPVESVPDHIRDDNWSDHKARRRRSLLVSRAEVALRLGDTGTAIRCCHEVLTSTPDHAACLEILAKALWINGAHHDLIGVLERLIELNPYEPGYRWLLAGSYERLGRYGDAIEAYERCGTQEADDAIEELEALQKSLLMDMASSDPVLRAHYAQDAQSACLSRGFRFRRSTASSWVPMNGTRSNYTRPS